MPLIPALRRQRQEELGEFEISLVYIVPGQPGLHSKTLSQTNKRKTTKKALGQADGSAGKELPRELI